MGPNPSPEDMGPPLEEHSKDGRYNCRGQRALYLSDSEEGVLRELAYEPMYIQCFEIPTGRLRIADLRQISSDSFLSGTMWHSEFAGLSGYPTKVFSQTVGEIVGRHFDGMAVPGVRGESGGHYSNIVILRNLGSWKEWLKAGIVPYKLLQ